MTVSTSVTVTSFQILVLGIFSAAALSCGQGEYHTGEDCCPLCPAGLHVNTHCTKFSNTSCLSCSEGTFMNQPSARTQCYTCLRCDTGVSLKTPCTTTSDTVCEPLEGFYCVFSKGGSCVRAHKHKSCEPGQIIRKNGTVSSDSVCSVCTDGTFSDGTFTVCRPHTRCELKNLQLTKAGTASSDAECGATSSNQTGILMDIVIFMVVVLLLGAVLFILYKRTRNRNPNTDQYPYSHSSFFAET